LRVARDEMARKTCRQWLDYPGFAEKHFNSLMGILDEEELVYRQQNECCVFGWSIQNRAGLCPVKSSLAGKNKLL